MIDSCDSDHPHDECGVIGVFAPHEDVARMTFFGLYALQHRGQEACGIAVSNGASISLHKDIGLVSQVFNPQNLAPLQGLYAIGHTRYSTTGSSTAVNSQPFLIDTLHGPIAVGHNGNLVNAPQLRQELMRRGVGMSSTSDSEVITMMLAGAEGSSWNERIKNCMKQWIGAFSLVILTRDGVFAVRDPWGFHPLSIGMLPSGGHAAASEIRRAGDTGLHRDPRGPSRRNCGPERHRPARPPGAPAPVSFGLMHLRTYLFFPPRQHLGRAVGAFRAGKSGPAVST